MNMIGKGNGIEVRGHYDVAEERITGKDILNALLDLVAFGLAGAAFTMMCYSLV